MRLEDWQKWLDSQFIDPTPIEPPAPPQPEPPSAHLEESPLPTPEAALLPPPVRAPEVFEAPQPAAAASATQSPALSESAFGSGAHVDEVDVPSIERYLPFLRNAIPPQNPPQELSAAAGQEVSAPVESEQPIANPALPAAFEPAVSAEPVESVATVFDSARPAQVQADPRAETASVTATREEATTRQTPLPSQEPEAPAPAAARQFIHAAQHSSRRMADTHRRTRQANSVNPSNIADELAGGELWNLVPRHIRSLVAMGSDEVTQNSYKRAFRESRIELVSKLLDPTLSLEDTARLLNVCPTTVRRYTNKGLLTHQRTLGDQRRFRLSDVLAFLEAQSRTESRQA